MPDQSRFENAVEKFHQITHGRWSMQKPKEQNLDSILDKEEDIQDKIMSSETKSSDTITLWEELVGSLELTPEEAGLNNIGTQDSDFTTQDKGNIWNAIRAKVSEKRQQPQTTLNALARFNAITKLPSPNLPKAMIDTAEGKLTQTATNLSSTATAIAPDTDKIQLHQEQPSTIHIADWQTGNVSRTQQEIQRELEKIIPKAAIELNGQKANIGIVPPIQRMMEGM